MSGNPKGLVASHDVPAQVSVDETFDLTLQITNTGNTDIDISDIDLKSMFNPTILDGVLVLGTEPEMERYYSSPGVVTFSYNKTLASGESQIVIFHLQALKPGYFDGPVAIWVGSLAYEVYPSITVTK